MLTPARTGQAVGYSDLKCETVSPQMAFVWLSRVRKIWVTCWNCLVGGVCREEMVPDKKHEFQERPELDCPVVARALSVFTGLKAEVEPQLEQVGNMPGF